MMGLLLRRLFNYLIIFILGLCCTHQPPLCFPHLLIYNPYIAFLSGTSTIDGETRLVLCGVHHRQSEIRLCDLTVWGLPLTVIHVEGKVVIVKCNASLFLRCASAKRSPCGRLRHRIATGTSTTPAQTKGRQTEASPPPHPIPRIKKTCVYVCVTTFCCLYLPFWGEVAMLGDYTFTRNSESKK